MKTIIAAILCWFLRKLGVSVLINFVVPSGVKARQNTMMVYDNEFPDRNIIYGPADNPIIIPSGKFHHQISMN